MSRYDKPLTNVGMNQEQFSLPTPTGRLIGRILLVCGILSLLLVQPFSVWYVHTLKDIGDTDLSRRILIASSIVPSILFATLTSWLLALGHRAISSRHWPPRGMPILYRTRIHDGQQALVDGILCMVAGVFTGLLACFWFYLAWRSWNLQA